MKRIATGAVVGLAVWFGSALAAEAQQITPTGPLKIEVTDTSEVYTATITTNYSFWFYLTVTNNGTTVYSNQWYITNSGPSYNFTSPSLNTASWGLAVGNTIDFHSTVQLGISHRVSNDYYLTVQSGGTSMAPRTETDSLLAAAMPTTKEEIEEHFAWDDRSNA
jgi:hypothetical protein